MAFLSPKQIVDEMYIKKHSTVIDIGAGSGAYIFEVCRVVGHGGKIVAVDIDAEKLKMVQSTAKTGGYVVDTMLANIESGIVLPDYSADYVIFANTLHQIDSHKREYVISEACRILAPRGYMLFVEWKQESMLGPKKELLISESEIENIFKKNNLKVTRELAAGDYHYAYILEKE